METKEFHIGDVLSITTGRLVSPSHMDGVYAILNYMSGDDLCTHQLPRVSNECSPFLLKQFPQLDTPAIKVAIKDLDKMLGKAAGTEENGEIVLDWLSNVTNGKYGLKGLPLCGDRGDMLMVAKLPADTHEFIDPKSELAEMVHPDQIVTFEP